MGNQTRIQIDRTTVLPAPIGGDCRQHSLIGIGADGITAVLARGIG